MANVRAATGNVLDTVVATSNAVCDTIQTVGKTARYASNWMDAVLANQKVQLRVDAVIFENTYAEQRALELTAIRKQITAAVGDDQQSKALYEQSLNQIREAIGK